VRTIARHDAKTQLLMSTPGVGAIVGLTYACAIDDPARFKSSKRLERIFGMTPKKYQSGETDYTGRISKNDDKGVRTALFEAAHVILTKAVKGSALKSWAMRLAKRAGMKKAKVALAPQAGRNHASDAGRRTTFDFRCRGDLTGRTQRVRAGHDTSLLEAKSLRRDDGQIRPQPIPWHTPRDCRLVGLSSSISDPVRWRPCADPVQKRDPGERTTQGIDQSRPVTERCVEPLRNPSRSASASGAEPVGAQVDGFRKRSTHPTRMRSWGAYNPARALL
jgi:hypothetical protein